MVQVALQEFEMQGEVGKDSQGHHQADGESN